MDQGVWRGTEPAKPPELGAGLSAGALAVDPGAPALGWRAEQRAVVAKYDFEGFP